jgi:hypothetical protein
MLVAVISECWHNLDLSTHPATRPYRTLADLAGVVGGRLRGQIQQYRHGEGQQDKRQHDERHVEAAGTPVARGV